MAALPRDNVASKEKDINKEQVATKAIAYEETFEKVTQKTDSENNKQTESNQQDANASDLSDQSDRCWTGRHRHR